MSAAIASTERHCRATSFVLAIAIVLPACGGSSSPTRATSGSTDVGTEKPTSSAQAMAEAAPPPPEKTVLEFPTACAKESGGDVCVPPVAFAKHLCSAGNAASLALALFAKGTPWVRLYLTRNTEAWDASGPGSGGASTKLAFDEEVIVLAYRPANPGGMIVSGANGAYDIVRWDGMCASLNADELRKWYPPEPGWAPIPWRKLDDDMQQKLLTDGRISLKEGEMKKACKGLSRTQTNAACDRTQKSLSKAVVTYVRNGGALATPKMP